MQPPTEQNRIEYCNRQLATIKCMVIDDAQKADMQSDMHLSFTDDGGHGFILEMPFELPWKMEMAIEKLLDARLKIIIDDKTLATTETTYIFYSNL